MTKEKSFKSLAQGHSVVVFEEPEYGGRQRAFTADTDHAGILNDMIRSLVVVPERIDQLCYTVFAHLNFQGGQEKFCGDMRLPDRWQDKVSGVRVHQQDVSLILYEGVFVGQFRYVSGEVPQLGEGWKNKPLSIQVRPWIVSDLEGYIQPRTQLFEEKDFGGKKIEVGPLTEYIGDEMNEKVSSIMCEGQCGLLLFEHRDYGGHSQLLNGSQVHLSSFDNRLSSLIVAPSEFCVTLYEHKTFEGMSISFCSDTINLDYFGWNDRVSSLKLQCFNIPCSIEIYEHSKYEGKSTSLTGHVPFVGDSWNEMLTSFKIRPIASSIPSLKAKPQSLPKATEATVKKSIKVSLEKFSTRTKSNTIFPITKSNSLDSVKYAELADGAKSPKSDVVLTTPDKEGVVDISQMAKIRLDHLTQLIKTIIDDAASGVNIMKCFYLSLAFSQNKLECMSMVTILNHHTLLQSISSNHGTSFSLKLTSGPSVVL
jgi:hypothetical protein